LARVFDTVDISGVTMPNLLIRNIEPELKRQIQERARAHRRGLSDEAIALLRQGLIETQYHRKLGTELSNLIRPEDRGDDLVFEYRGDMPKPPDFD
jgi:antitoxin FitA